MCCRDVLIDNVFMRNSDDCIALYNHRLELVGRLWQYHSAELLFFGRILLIRLMSVDMETRNTGRRSNGKPYFPADRYFGT